MRTRVFKPEMFGHTDGDPADRLNEMFEFAKTAPWGSVFDWSGTYEVNDTIFVQGEQHRHLPGRLIATEAVMDVLQWDARWCDVVGHIRIEGPGGVSFDTRGCINGVRLLNAYRTRFFGFDIRNMRRHAITSDFGISCDLGMVSANEIGSAAGQATAELILTYVDRDDEGGPTDPNQKSILELSNWEDPDDLQVGDIIFDGDNPHVIRATTWTLETDKPNTIEVYPILRHGHDTGVLVSSHGAAVNVQGGDTTGLGASHIFGQRCGTVLRAAGLYGGNWGHVGAEVSGIGIQLGHTPSDVVVGGRLQHPHFEGTKLAGVRVLRNPTTFAIGPQSVWRPKEWVSLQTTDVASWEATNPVWGSFEGMIFEQRVPQAVDRLERARNRWVGPPTPYQVSNWPEESRGTLIADAPHVNLNWDPEPDRLWGHSRIVLEFIGTDPMNRAPGRITITTPDGTINGIPETSTGFPDDGVVTLHRTADTGPVRLTFIRDVDREDWIMIEEKMEY